jgi:hypothetical protein
MNANRKTAVVVGVLFLVGYIGVFLGSAIYAPVLDSPDYLSSLYSQRSKVIAGMLVELINDASVVGIAVLLFPILKQYGEGLALGYVGVRVIEAVTLAVSKVSILALIPMSQQYAAAGAGGNSVLQSIGDFALAGRYWAGKIQVFFFVLGTVILFYLLYRSILVPRLISIWGFIAVASLAAANLLGAPDPTQSFQPAMLLYFPIIISEWLLAIWLIVKGFSPSRMEISSRPQLRTIGK